MNRFFLLILPRRRWLGFTLIEILVILMVIGVLAGITAPSVIGYLETLKVKNAIVDIRFALQESQNQAIQQQSNCKTNVFLPQKFSNPSTPITVNGSCLTRYQRTLPAEIELFTNIKLAPNTLISHQPKPLIVSSRLSGSIFANFNKSDPGRSISWHNLSKSWFMRWFRSNNPARGNKNNTSRPPQKQNLAPPTAAFPKQATQDGEAAEQSVIQVTFNSLGSARFQIESQSPTPPDTTGKIIALNRNRKKAPKRCIAISRTLGLTRIGTYKGEDDLTPERITDQGSCTALDWSQQ